MKVKYLSFLIFFAATPAFAGWQYNGYYVNDGYYNDDGSKFVMGIRGGLSIANAKMKNEIGSLDGYYYINPTTGMAVSQRYFADETEAENNGFTETAVGNIGTLPIKKKFSKTSFAAGASVGFTIPYHPQWRLEAGYDYISETKYNQVPLLEGELKVSGEYDGIVHVSSTGVASTVSTDVISAMAYYDFFDGNKKNINEIIPYVGFGLGYASSKTTLKLADIYGDLSTDSDMQNYGSIGSDGVIQFSSPSDKSKYPSSTNIAVIGTVGASYGITEYTFLDFNARVMYIPKIVWELVSSDASHHREWFSADNMLYTNFMVGLRFEF